MRLRQREIVLRCMLRALQACPVVTNRALDHVASRLGKVRRGNIGENAQRHVTSQIGKKNKGMKSSYASRKNSCIHTFHY